MDDLSYFGTVTADALRRIAHNVDGADLRSGTCQIATRGRVRDFLAEQNSPFVRLAQESYSALVVVATENDVEHADMVLADVEREPHVLERASFHDVSKVRIVGSVKRRRRRSPPMLPEVEEAIRYIMRSLGERIEHLELSRVHPAHALKWAALCPSLQTLDCSVRDLLQLLPLWRQLPDLRRLELRTVDPSAWPATLDALTHLCRKLTDISLSDPTACNELTSEDVITFVRGYGVQLQSANLRKMSPRLCSSLLASCPKVRVFYVELRHNFESIAALGDNLDVLHISIEDDELDCGPFDGDELRMAMASCRQLSSLDVGGSLNNPMGMDYWEALFSAPMRNLHNLSLPTLGNPLDVCKLIASHTQNICSLTLTLYAMADANWLETLVRANPQLQDLNVAEIRPVWNRNTSEATGVLLTALMKVLRLCRRLQKVRVDLESHCPPLDVIRDILVPWRYRGVVIELEFLDHCVKDDGAGNLQFGEF